MDLTQLQPADFKRWQIIANLSFPCLFFSFWLPSSKQSYGRARWNRPAWFRGDFPFHPTEDPTEIHGTDLCGEEGQALGQPTFVPMNLRRLVPTERKKTGDGYGDEAHVDIYIYTHKLYTYMYMVNIWSIYVEYHENWILGFIGYAIQLSNK